MINKIPKNPRLGQVLTQKLTADKFNEILDYQKPITLVDEAIVKWNMRKGYNATLTIGGNRTLQIDQLTPGDYGTIKIIQDATGNRALALPSGSKVANSGSGALTLSGIGGTIDIATFYYDGINLFWTLSLNFT